MNRKQNNCSNSVSGFNIVTELARKSGCTLSDEELCREANKWELSHGGISGRTATQFVNYIMANN